MNSPQKLPDGLAADLMATAVPIAASKDTVSDALAAMRRVQPAEASHVYLTGENGILLGQVPIEKLLGAPPDTCVGELQGRPPIEVRPDQKAETAALLAVEQHDADVAVVDAHRKFLGAIPISRLLALLHREHVDDILRMGGVNPNHPAPVLENGTLQAFRARLPWLIIGLLGGFLAGGVASLFESSLKQEVTLVFFLPLVVYMADAIGTQTETILVRALAYGHVSVGRHLVSEGLIGILIGGVLALVAGSGLLLWHAPIRIVGVVALTLFTTAIIATTVATILPLMLAKFGVDPALASGPVATVLQDILSVAVYLSIAAFLL